MENESKTQENKSKTRRFLRPEARPLHWSLLNSSQQDAFLKILQALNEARNDLDNAERTESKAKPATLLPNFPKRTDPHRSSRLIFLSGQRGTGKSTVLISLLDGFLNVFAEGDGEEKYKETKTTKQILDLLKGLRHRLIWLEPLDMEPLPRPTNLLAAILARIDKAVTQFVSSSGDSTRPAGLLNLASGERALLDLRKLASDIAIAWDGNVEDRAGALDPDTYAEEVNRVEEARLGINRRLDDVLDALAKELERTREVRNPLFVLPVDDYDLNPLRALDLLQLIRMVSSPRLFILVLGDVRMAEVMFNLKKSGEFARILEDAKSSDYLSLSPGEIASTARTLSGHAIRKLIPPGQRLSLGNMEVEEALKFHPDLLDNSQGLRTLRTLLQGLPVEIETAVLSDSQNKTQCVGGRSISNLKEFLLFDLLSPQPQDNSEPKDKETAGAQQGNSSTEPHRKKSYPYTGSTLLKATPRYIADLWFSLDELVGDQPALPELGTQPWKDRLSELIERIGQEAHRAVEEDPLLSIRYRERFVDALGVGADEGWLQAMKFVEARSIAVPGRRVAFRKQGCVLNASFQRSWSFWDLGERKPIDIDERAKALLILLHDLLALEREGGIIGSHALSPDSLNLGWAYASWDVGLEEVKIQWITPAWTSFWEFEQFSNIWQEALHSKVWNQFSDEPEQRAFLAYVWIAAATRILCGKEDLLPVVIPESAKQVTQKEDKLWSDLRGAIEHLIKSLECRDARADRIESWLTRLPVLLSPESGFMAVNEIGIMRNLVDHLFKIEGVQKFFTDERIQSKIRRLRADRLAPFVDTKQIDQFLDDEHVINAVPIGSRTEHSFKPEESELTAAKARFVRRGLTLPMERLAMTLEVFSSDLRKELSAWREDARKGRPEGG